MKYLKLLFAALLFSSASIALAGNKVSPASIAGATTVDTAKAKALFDNGILFLDVRKDKDWDAGRVPDAIHIELKKKLTEESMAKEVKKDEEVVIYCNGEKCMRSSKASAKAVGWGFSKVYYYRDGFPAWKAAGHPVE